MLGIGEVSIIPRISPDDFPDYELHINNACKAINQLKLSVEKLPSIDKLLQILVFDLVPETFPSLRFALEGAVRGFVNGHHKIIFKNNFTHGKRAIPINGLIWTEGPKRMLKLTRKKIVEGYSCIKMKIGTATLADDLSIIKTLREQYSAKEVTIRVDANGSFSPAEALGFLTELADLEVHSIEQPIAKGQIEAMAALCKQSPLPIALDEELTGYYSPEARKELLESIKPQFIVLKPSFLGGFEATANWIAIAEELGIGWWITSALESNVGLNAIAQFTGQYPVTLPQGLGTGQLFTKNFPWPLTAKAGYLTLRNEKE